MFYNYLLAWVLGFLTSWVMIGVFLLVRYCRKEYRKDKQLSELWTDDALG